MTFQLKRAFLLLIPLALLAPFALKGLARHEGTKTATDLCQWLNGASNMPSYVTAGTETRAVLNGLRIDGRPVTCIVVSTPFTGSAWTEATVLLSSSINNIGLRVAPLGQKAEIRGYFTP